MLPFLWLVVQLPEGSYTVAYLAYLIAARSKARAPLLDDGEEPERHRNVLHMYLSSAATELSGTSAQHVSVDRAHCG